jgi:hypothetical protein
MQCKSASHEHLSKIYKIQCEEKHKSDIPCVLLEIINMGLSYILVENEKDSIIGYALLMIENDITIVYDFVLKKKYQKTGAAYTFWGFVEMENTSNTYVLKSNDRSRMFWKRNGFEPLEESDDVSMTKTIKK